MLEFEWDPAKNRANLAKHGIDFDDAIDIFASSVLVLRSDRPGEDRWLAVGLLDGLEITIVYTIRRGIYRIISARRARGNERRAHGKAHPGG